MLRPLILDGRNLLNGDEMAALGFEYQGIGKPIEETARAECEVLDSIGYGSVLKPAKPTIFCLLNS